MSDQEQPKTTVYTAHPLMHSKTENYVATGSTPEQEICDFIDAWGERNAETHQFFLSVFEKQKKDSGASALFKMSIETKNLVKIFRGMLQDPNIQIAMKRAFLLESFTIQGFVETETEDDE